MCTYVRVYINRHIGIPLVCVCVCVCVGGIPVPKEATSVHSFARMQGAVAHSRVPLPTKLLLRWEDIQADHLDVPAVM